MNSRITSWLLAGLVAAAVPNLAWAGPREDMKAAYDQALAQANELEYDAALATINNAISTAESGPKRLNAFIHTSNNVAFLRRLLA